MRIEKVTNVEALAAEPIQRWKQNGAIDGYHWCLSHWGVKWNADMTMVERTEDELNLAFDTAWSPPEAWVKFAAHKFPLLQFKLRYMETGIDFCGEIVFAAGEIVREQQDDTVSDEAYEAFYGHPRETNED